VDSGSTDSTLEIARKHNAKIIIAPGPFNHSKSLNLGFRAVKNDWVLVISSHCIPIVPDLLGIYRREIAHFPPDIAAGYGTATISGKSDPVLDRDKTSFYSQVDRKVVFQVCGSANTIYPRSVWEQVPFDEKVRTGEDKLWILEVLPRGYRFAYIPAARGANKYQASLRYMFRKGFYEARIVRYPNHKPMTIKQISIALLSLVKKRILGEMDTRVWSRYAAYRLGNFFGTYRDQDNTPDANGT
jgi:glycosyltransferase involved in cell wall biosynthesis